MGRLWMVVVGACLLVGTAPVLPQQEEERLDVVLAGGRVFDPETGLDEVRSVGIGGDRIVAVSAEDLSGALRPDGLLLDVSGLVVAPGFIDLHAHGQSSRANEYQAHDGVTTALELEWGYPRIADWIESRRGRALINYGASVSHGMVRSLVMPELAERASRELEAAATEEDPLRSLQSILGEGFYRPLPEGGLEDLRRLLKQGLAEGGLGIGMAHQYYPGASREEIFRVFQLAAEREVPIYTHVRSMGIDAMQEVIADAAATGAPLHIVHVNSSSLGDLPVVLEIIAAARERGIDVTTESYPYTAGSTSIQSSIFDEGWQERLGIGYGDIQWQDTGDRLTAESFAHYREQGGTVIIHMMRQEMIDLAISTPFVIVASDGMPYAPGAHPRSAGTFSRVLGRYVRERGTLDLMAAIKKMTLMPAQRLEAIAPDMRHRGRVQEDAFADLVVFDPATILDTATFEEDLSFSQGVMHVLVNGEPVVRDGESVPGVFPGRPILGRYGE